MRAPTRCGSGSSASSRRAGSTRRPTPRCRARTATTLIDDAEPDAEKALRREAVLSAVADAEEIEPTDEELIEALGPGEGKNSPEKLLARLRETGRDAMLRDEVRMRPAADAIAEAAKPIPVAQAEAREKIWTPDKGEAATPGGGERRGQARRAMDAGQLIA